MAKKQRRPKGRRIKCIALLFVLLAALLLLFEPLLKQYYKLPDPALVKEAAGVYGLDPALVAAVIHVESKNDPNALSEKGAMGLMQIMPKTGSWIAGKLDDLPDFQEADLYDPGINIRCGCWYLDYLLNRFSDLRLALVAYNAGPGTLKNWLEDESLSDGKELFEIPYKETAAYVERVFESMEKYRYLYEDELS